MTQDAHNPPVKKLVCLDFDQTITTINFHNMFVEAKYSSTISTKAIAGWFKAFPPEDYIRNRVTLCKTIRELINKPGISVAITSTNVYSNLIPFMLEAVGLTKEEIAKHIIYIPCPPRTWDNSWRARVERALMDEATYAKTVAWREKLSIIEQSMGKAGLTKHDKKHVLLVDDEEFNIESAKNLGFSVIHSPSLGGDRPTYLQETRRWAGLELLSKEEMQIQPKSTPSGPQEPKDPFLPEGRRPSGESEPPTGRGGRF